MADLKVVSETQLKEWGESGYDYVRLSFPQSDYDPIFVVYKEKPSKEALRELVSSLYNNTVEKYVLTCRKEMEDGIEI